MKFKKLFSLLMVLLAIGAQDVLAAGTITFTDSVDSSRQLWIMVNNDMEYRDVTITKIDVSVYDSNSNLLERASIPCTTNCTVTFGMERNFGPIPLGQNVATYYVENVYYNAN